jgi:hypothetical protein
MKLKKDKWEHCTNCMYLAEMCSHPWVDKKPLSNKLGYACVFFYIIENGPIIPNWDRDSIQCEMHTPRNEQSL